MKTYLSLHWLLDVEMSAEDDRVTGVESMADWIGLDWMSVEDDQGDWVGIRDRLE